jgi:hypothetical protein
MRFARIEDGTVAEIVTVPPGYTIDEMFAPAFVSRLVPTDARVQPGWKVGEDGKIAAPPAPAEPAPKPRRTRKKPA